MKKAIRMAASLSLVLALGIFTLTGCGDEDTSGGNDTKVENDNSGANVNDDNSGADNDNNSANVDNDNSGADVNGGTTDGTDAAEGVMTHADYMAAELESEVVIDTYVQAKQAWRDNKATIYAQSKDGAYFIYGMTCSEEDYAKLTTGTKIRVTGFKTEWSGEVEIAEGATFEILGGDTYVATPTDVTALLGTNDLIAHQNELVSFKGMTVEASKDADDNDVVFLYNWNGSGQDGNDLYFNVSVNGATYTFTVESDLCDNTTDVYAAVKALNIGDVIDMEGFLYWYNGVNPHITSVKAAQ